MRRSKYTLIITCVVLLLAGCKGKPSGQTGVRDSLFADTAVATKENSSGIFSPSEPHVLSPEGRLLEAQGYVNIAKADSTILVSLMYTRADNFTGRVLYDSLSEAYLHPDAIGPLMEAQRLLRESRPDLSLIVFDAARPMSIQQQMWDVVAGTAKSKYVSNPARGGGMHNYGLAVDISLADANGDTIPMGTRVDYMGTESHITDEQALVSSGKLTAEAMRNRRLLRRVMTAAGFKPLNGEWWHFNLVDRKTAVARYKPII